MDEPGRKRKGPIFEAKTLKAWREPGTFCDDQGGGLYLQVRQMRVKGVLQWETERNGERVPKVTKYWTYRYWRRGPGGTRKLKELGIGPFTDYTIDQARDKAREQRILRDDFLDPIQVRKKRKQEAQDLIATMKTFKEATEACWNARKSGWDPGYADDWLRSLETHAYPVLGSMEIRTIRTTHIDDVLRPIWEELAETASRVRGRIETVFDFAKGKEWFTGDNPGKWKGNLDALFNKSPRLKKLRNFPSLPYEQLGLFMAALRKERGIAALALEFQILTATRPGETRGATCDEFDLKKSLWIIHAERMKGKIEHVIPLSARAIQIVRSMGELKPGAFLFPGGKPGKCLSDAAMSALIDRMVAGRREKEGLGWVDKKGIQIVPHGFRASFKTWGTDSSSFDRNVIEFALAHKLPDKVEAAYNRGTMLEKRRPLMKAWSEFCDPENPNWSPTRSFRRIKDYADPDPKIVRVEVDSE
jgi:integrase